MPTCTVTTEVTGLGERATALSVPSDRLAVRELIERKVRAEIGAWRGRREPDFGNEYRDGEWNVQPGARARRVDENAEVEKALAAFAEGRFLVFVDDVQATEPERLVLLGPDTRIRFIRVIALAGG